MEGIGDTGCIEGGRWFFGQVPACAREEAWACFDRFGLIGIASAEYNQIYEI